MLLLLLLLLLPIIITPACLLCSLWLRLFIKANRADHKGHDMFGRSLDREGKARSKCEDQLKCGKLVGISDFCGKTGYLESE